MRLDPRPENQKTSSCHNWYKHKHIGTFKRGSGYGRKLRFSRLGALKMWHLFSIFFLIWFFCCYFYAIQMGMEFIKQFTKKQIKNVRVSSINMTANVALNFSSSLFLIFDVIWTSIYLLCLVFWNSILTYLFSFWSISRYPLSLP